MASRRRTLTSLYEEHVLLGATFGGSREVSSYTEEELSAAETAVGEGAILCDMSTTSMVMFCGSPAEDFANTAFAGKRLAIGECALEAVLTGDGSVASVPLLMRTGGSEYVLMDASPRAEVLDGWLSFLAGVEQDGVAPFGGLEHEDVTGSHVVLILGGNGATRILGDYTSIENLPRFGEVRSCDLDRIPCIVANLSGTPWHTYIILVPPQLARPLWRSLLSFTEVMPIGTATLWRLLRKPYPWGDALYNGDRVHIPVHDLMHHGLIRASSDFVGARGLFLTNDGGIS